LKILYVTTISDTVNAFLIPHIKLLLEAGHQVDVAFNTVQKESEELIKLGCKIHSIDFQRLPIKIDNYKSFKKIKKLVLQEGYDLIHTHTPIAAFLTRLACRNIPNLKMLYTAHGFHFFKGAPIKNWLIFYPIEKIAAKWTDIIITINEEDYISAKKMRLRMVDSVYKVHGVGVNFNKFKPQTCEKKKDLRKQYGYSDEEFILICVAELNYNKHQDLLINAVSLLKNKIPNIKLLLVGEGSLKEKYKEDVKNLGLEKNINFLGYISDVPNLLMIADVLISASRREGLPVSVMEAMATGLPIVCSSVRGNSDLIENGKGGYLIDPENVEGFSDAIKRLLEDKYLCEQMGAYNIQMINYYDIVNVKQEIAKIYSILGSR
jgi:glycosyltransferase EpsD